MTVGQAVQKRAAKAVKAAPKIAAPAERVTVLLGGLVEWDNDHFPVRLRSLSRTGAEIEATMIPPVGSTVRFSRGMLFLSGRVVATTESRFEIEFSKPRESCDLLLRLGAGRPTAMPTYRFERDEDDDERFPVWKH
jgi:hypothetical protein